mgnify:CR=1 FL=1
MDLEDAKIDGKKLTVTLPQQLLDRLSAHMPIEKINQFVEKAIADQLAFEQQFATLEQKSDEWWEGKLDLKPAKSDEELSVWLEDIRQKMG